MSAISVQLGHLRVARGLTQQQLADRTGLRRDTISALERGKSQAIEFDTLGRLCDALGVNAAAILANASSGHTAPILGGEDEDSVIAERLAEAEDEIAALIANPAHMSRARTDANAFPAHTTSGTDLNAQVTDTSRDEIVLLETTVHHLDFTAWRAAWQRLDPAKSTEAAQRRVLVGFFALQDGELVAVPLDGEVWSAALTGSLR